MNSKQRKSWLEKHEKNMLPELRKAQSEREQKQEIKTKAQTTAQVSTKSKSTK